MQDGDSTLSEICYKFDLKIKSLISDLIRAAPEEGKVVLTELKKKIVFANNSEPLLILHESQPYLEKYAYCMLEMDTKECEQYLVEFDLENNDDLRNYKFPKQTDYEEIVYFSTIMQNAFASFTTRERDKFLKSIYEIIRLSIQYKLLELDS